MIIFLIFGMLLSIALAAFFGVGLARDHRELTALEIALFAALSLGMGGYTIVLAVALRNLL